MKLSEEIKACSILIIMLLGMMHNAFPHVHHEHDPERHAELIGESHHHHHDSDHHHQSGEEENDHEETTFLGFLFKNHSHTKHTHQYTPAKIEHVERVTQVVIKFLGSNDSWAFSVAETDTGLHNHVLFNVAGLADPNLSLHPLRGPPSLG